MNKKSAILICLLAVFGMRLSAQDEIHYGFFLGGSVNMMNIDTGFYYDDSKPVTTTHINVDTTYTAAYLHVDNASVKPNASIMLGGFFEYNIDKSLALQFEIFYNQYGYKLEGTVDQKNISDDDVITYDYKSNMRISNFSAALLLKIKPTQHLSVDLGVQPSYCFRMIKEAKYGILHESTVYDSKEYNPLNFSVLGGVTGYMNDFYLALRYSFGFIDIMKTKQPYYFSNNNFTEIKYLYENAKSTTSSVQLTLGYKIK